MTKKRFIKEMINGLMIGRRHVLDPHKSRYYPVISIRISDKIKTNEYGEVKSIPDELSLYYVILKDYIKGNVSELDFADFSIDMKYDEDLGIISEFITDNGVYDFDYYTFLLSRLEYLEISELH